MLSRSFLTLILDDESLVRGLGDPEASALVEWLVECAEDLSVKTNNASSLKAQVHSLVQRAKAISRFVHLWCHRQDPGSAGQLAATVRFQWPLPTPGAEPWQIMSDILSWERKAI